MARSLEATTATHERANDLLEAVGLDHLQFTEREARESNWMSVAPLRSARPKNCFSQNSHYVRFPHSAHLDADLDHGIYADSHHGVPIPTKVYTLSVIQTQDVDEVEYVGELFKHAVNQFESTEGFRMGDRDLKASAYLVAYTFLSTLDAERTAADEYDADEVTPDTYDDATSWESDDVDVKFDDGHTIQVKMNGAGGSTSDADEMVDVTVKP